MERGAERFKGYAAHEIIRHHFSRFYPPEALKAGLPAHELEVAQATGTYRQDRGETAVRAGQCDRGTSPAIVHVLHRASAATRHSAGSAVNAPVTST